MNMWPAEEGTRIGGFALYVVNEYSCQIVGNGDVKFPTTINRIRKNAPDTDIIFIGESDLDISADPLIRLKMGLVKFVLIGTVLYKVGDFETALPNDQYTQISIDGLIRKLGFKPG